MMIFAAGQGTRLRPLTYRLPKPLVQVRGKPLIEYHLEKAVEIGIQNIVINVSYLREQIMRHLGDGAAWGLNIDYSIEPKPLETAGGLVHARKYLGQGAFLVCNADIYHESDLAWIQKENVTSPICLMMVPNPPEQPEGNFFLESAGSLQEKPQSDANRHPGGEMLTYSGVGCYHTDFVDSIDELGTGNPECERTPYYLKRWMAKGQVQGIKFDGLWCDVGTGEKLKWLERHLSGG